MLAGGPFVPAGYYFMFVLFFLWILGSDPGLLVASLHFGAYGLALNSRVGVGISD